jgi:hypothetical protein
MKVRLTVILRSGRRGRLKQGRTVFPVGEGPPNHKVVIEVPLGADEASTVAAIKGAPFAHQPLRGWVP